eukprot:TRINITY_DN23805_c0_g1_i1.p1 TRINITY_DN23805_c0_g1~~TRINITY_DN23805_c0_g1_i1.p1  ORF type:complete len:226 (+),score=32.59 TRINITY_DN23805_c0_g1_i1:68-679(+)
MKRLRSVVVLTPGDQGEETVWLDKRDQDWFSVERAPQVLRWDEEKGYAASLGFVLRLVEYECVVYLDMERWQPDAIDVTLESETECVQVMETAVTQQKGKPFARIAIHLQPFEEGLHNYSLKLTANNTATPFVVHCNVLKESQGHPALCAGSRRIGKLANYDTEAESEWHGFPHLGSEGSEEGCSRDEEQAAEAEEEQVAGEE